MKVKDFRAFRVIKADSLNYEKSVFSGKSTICRNDFPCNFRQIYEEVFEEVRLKTMISSVSRLNCIFVFPNKNNFEEWSLYERGTCYLLELSLTGELLWLDAKFINEDLIPYRQKKALTSADVLSINTIAEKYWKSADRDDVIDSQSCEGLFRGKVELKNIEEISIESKNHRKHFTINIDKSMYSDPASDDDILKD